MTTTIDIKKEHTITIKLGYAEGSHAADCINIEADCSVLDFVLAREAITQQLHDKDVNVAQFISTMAEAYARDDRDEEVHI